MEEKYFVFEITEGKGIRQISQDFDLPAEAEAFIETMKDGYTHKDTKLVIGKVVFTGDNRGIK